MIAALKEYITLRRVLIVFGISVAVFLFIFRESFYDVYLDNSQRDNPEAAYHKEPNAYFKTVHTYIIDNIDEFKDVYFTAMNNRWDSVSFKCSNKYSDCMRDFEKTLKDSVLTNALNDYLHPYNQYKTMTYYYNDKVAKIKIQYLYTTTEIKHIEESIKGLHLKTVEDVNNYVKYNVKYLKGSNSLLSIIDNRQGNCKAISDFVNAALYDLNRRSFTISNNIHAWNALIENGQILHVDATFNIISNNYYFKLTDEELFSLHEPEHQIPDIYKKFYLEKTTEL